MNIIKTSSLTKTAIMAVLVFLGTYLLKIPIAGGYAHLGDGMIILGVVLVGTKKGATAAGVGAAFADLLSGYAIWAVPTLLIKVVMALIIGVFAEKVFVGKQYGWLVGAVVGGIFQIAGYAFVEMLLYGLKTALVDVPMNVMQTCIGILLAVFLVQILRSSGALERLKDMK